MGKRGQRFKFVDLPVIDGKAYLPDGSTVDSGAQVVRLAVLTGDRRYERIKKFRAQVKLRGWTPEDMAMRAVIQELAGPLTGDRGGRYIPFGPTVFDGIAEVGDDFIRNERTASGWRMARYVRPGAA